MELLGALYYSEKKRDNYQMGLLSHLIGAILNTKFEEILVMPHSGVLNNLQPNAGLPSQLFKSWGHSLNFLYLVLDNSTKDS